MVEALKLLTEEEKSIVMNTPVWVGVLISVSDNRVDPREREDAVKLVHYRRFTASPPLRPLFEQLDGSYEERFNECLAALPEDHDARIAELSEKIAQLNRVLPKVDSTFARSYVEDMRTFAEHIAKSSGGFLYFFSETPEEHYLSKLPMITVFATESG